MQKIIGRNDLGAITAGKTADIAGWGRDIMTDHKAAVSECDFVMKEGIIYKLQNRNWGKEKIGVLAYQRFLGS